MEEGLFSDSLPDLKELENKIGRKTPESLLIWMRDAVPREECWSSDGVARKKHNSISDSFSDKIRNLKLEMSRLRSVDVSILRQLVAVHEGIEAMRWLMEERGTLTSRGSSLTGSLTSLVALEVGSGSSMSPCRESPSPISQQDRNDTAENEELSDPMLNNDDDVLCHTKYFDQRNSESTMEWPPRHSGSKSGLSCTAEERHSQAWSSPNAATANNLVSSANQLELQPQVSDLSLTQDLKTRAEYRIHTAEPVRRALVRSSRSAIRGLTGGGRSAPSLETEEDTSTHCDLPRESPRACESSVAEAKAEQSMPSREEVLLGYDAQWRWVESEDDVTFL